MSAEPKLTAWLPGTLKPTLPGVYQRRFRYNPDAWHYARWDGTRWYEAGDTPMLAMEVVAQSVWPYLPWRGLAEAPR